MAFLRGRRGSLVALIGGFTDDEGATMVEYGLMLALIAIVCIVAVTAIGGNANTIFSDISLHSALGGSP